MNDKAMRFNFTEIKKVVDNGEVHSLNNELIEFWKGDDNTYWFIDWFDGGEELYHYDWESFVEMVKRFVGKNYHKEYVEYV